MKPILSALPLPPKEYSQDYMNRLVRQLQLMINQYSQSFPLDGTSDLTQTVHAHPISALTLYDIPTSPTDLPEGSVYSDSGTLKIV